jgi:tripartite ATP-independent transporter DctM subunit
MSEPMNGSVHEGVAYTDAARRWQPFALVEHLTETLVGLAILIELALVLGNMLARIITNRDAAWTYEAAELALTVMAFVGGPLALRRGLHISVRILLDRLRPRQEAVLTVVANWLILGIGVALVGLSGQLMVADWVVKTPIMQLPYTVFVFPAFVGMLALVCFAIERLIKSPKRLVVTVGTALILSGGGLFVIQPLWLSLLTTAELFVASFALLLLLLLIGVPIGFVLALVPLTFLYLTGVAPPIVIVQRMEDTTQNFVLLTIPFFIFAGLIMANGGLGERLADLFQSLLGHFRGGLLYVIVVFMYIFSGLSGSKTADMSAVGTTMAPSLARFGYSEHETTGVLAASAAMGETIPPSIGLLVLAAVTSLSIPSLFVAGIAPAATLALCLMVLIYWRSRRAQLRPVQRATGPQRWRALWRSVPALFLPVLLVGGILSGIGSPTEVSSVAVVYGLAGGLVLERSSTLATFRRTLLQTASLNGMVLFIISTASAFSWVLTVEDLPRNLAAALVDFKGHAELFMIVSIVALLVMGALLEGLPAIVIFAPLLIPAAVGLGINPLQFAIVLVIAMGIGFFIPYLGVGSYIACVITGANIERSAAPIGWYIAVLIVGLVVIALVPGITLWLPDLFHLT